MARRKSNSDSPTAFLDGSSRPIYAIDADRQVVYCNPALAKWLEIDRNCIIGRLVEYHSEPPIADDDAGPLTDLCPPPQVFAGATDWGTLSCMVRDGRLLHRRAEFIPLSEPTNKTSNRRQGKSLPVFGVLVILADADLSPPELAAKVSGEPTADELHRIIRRFRRAQVSRYSIESLLGSSLAMQRVRAQLAAAAKSGANTLIRGRVGSGRGHAARAIHYSTSGDIAANLLPVDCPLMNEDRLRRVLERLRDQNSGAASRPTLLLENVEYLQLGHQAQLASTMREKLLAARVIATCGENAKVNLGNNVPSEETSYQETIHSISNSSATIDFALWSAISTITIELPPLTSRLDDLPILAQYFLESCNQGSSKQVGAFRPDTLDALALYSWPGELSQLREIVASAHRATTSPEIAITDLPPLLHHASAAARHIRHEPERIVLDELLATIEKEAIVRALAATAGNKSEAAVLLGMTRPRLYRRLLQLGLVREDSTQEEKPEFIEQDPADYRE